MDRSQVVHDNFLARVAARDFPVSRAGIACAKAGLDDEKLVALFDAQVLSRQLDRISRQLQARGEAFYTIGSSGHEGNAAIAAAFRPTDIAFLHYRDAAFQIQRALQDGNADPAWDMLLSFVSSSDDPISGGRHKVLGSRPLMIPPQTSTIASHLPKAVGVAHSIALAQRLRPEHKMLENDGIVIASFGDASVNHSTAQGAFNAAGWTAWRGLAMPIVFVCEDNGIGISTPSPKGWVEAVLRARPGIDYFACDGLDVADTFYTARAVEEHVRRTRRPAFLHFTCVRLYGHAGADVQTSYRSQAEVEAEEAQDPLLHTARHLVGNRVLSPDQVLDRYKDCGERLAQLAEKAIKRPKLVNAREIMARLLAPPRAVSQSNGPSQAERAKTFGKADGKALEQPQHMAKLINFALTDLMLEHDEIVLAGEDVGRKGGVYGVTQRLQSRFGRARVMDTLLDEQSILGLSIGLAHNGIVPIAEIQFLAYLHNAEDQIRGEAATLPFFSDGQFANPMVVRIAGLGYQRGFGGHFHNDNSLAVLRDIPGLVVACPSNGRDAVLMLRECIRLARVEQRVCIFVEPIALYMTRDLHQADDSGWTHTYLLPGAEPPISLGQVGVHGDGEDLAIISYANGYFRARQAQAILAEHSAINARVVDLRWIAPLDYDAIAGAIGDCQKILMVDECRASGSVSEAILADFLLRYGGERAVGRITADDSFIATGPAYAATLPSRDAIVEQARNMYEA